MTKHEDAQGGEPLALCLGEELAAEDEATKVCTRCGEAKLLTEFYADTRYVGGYVHTCKPCYARRHAAWVSKNKDRVRALSKKHYDRTPPELRNQAARAYAEKDRLTLSDSYVKKALVQGSALKWRDVTPEMVEMKRHQLFLNRLARKLKKAANESSKDTR